MHQTLKKIVTAKRNYDITIRDIEESLKDKIEFEFTIFDQPSDGIVLLNISTSQNAMLSQCLDVIKLKGKLTLEDYSKLTF